MGDIQKTQLIIRLSWTINNNLFHLIIIFFFHTHKLLTQLYYSFQLIFHMLFLLTHFIDNLEDFVSWVFNILFVGLKFFIVLLGFLIFVHFFIYWDILWVWLLIDLVNLLLSHGHSFLSTTIFLRVSFQVQEQLTSLNKKFYIYPRRKY